MKPKNAGRSVFLQLISVLFRPSDSSRESSGSMTGADRRRLIGPMSSVRPGHECSMASISLAGQSIVVIAFRWPCWGLKQMLVSSSSGKRKVILSFFLPPTEG